MPYVILIQKTCKLFNQICPILKICVCPYVYKTRKVKTYAHLSQNCTNVYFLMNKLLSEKSIEYLRKIRYGVGYKNELIFLFNRPLPNTNRLYFERTNTIWILICNNHSIAKIFFKRRFWFFWVSIFFLSFSSLILSRFVIVIV